MKSEDLMLNDWVLTQEGEPAQVYQIYNGIVALTAPSPTLYNVECLQPIRLTPELLEKNGGKKYITGQYFLPQEDRNVVIFIADTRDFPNSNHTMLLAIKKVYNDVRIGVNYLHQLQHIFRLLNIEKEWIV